MASLPEYSPIKAFLLVFCRSVWRIDLAVCDLTQQNFFAAWESGSQTIQNREMCQVIFMFSV